MMTLYEKIISIYPELQTEPDTYPSPFATYIILRNDGDERGDYIDVWNHPTLPRPTEDQLK